IRTDSFTVRQDTTFNDGDPDTDYLQPSLRPDRDGNLLLVFHTRSDSNVVGVRATGRLATDALDTLQPSIEVRAGQGSQAGDSMGAPARSSRRPVPRRPRRSTGIRVASRPARTRYS